MGVLGSILILGVYFLISTPAPMATKVRGGVPGGSVRGEKLEADELKGEVGFFGNHTAV